MIVRAIHVPTALAVCFIIPALLDPLSFPLFRVLFQILGLEEHVFVTSPGMPESRLLLMYNPSSKPEETLSEELTTLALHGAATLGLGFVFAILKRLRHVQGPAFVEQASTHPVDQEHRDSRSGREDSIQSSGVQVEAPTWACTRYAPLSGSLLAFFSFSLTASTIWNYTAHFPLIDLNLWFSMLAVSCWVSCIFGVLLVALRGPAPLVLISSEDIPQVSPADEPAGSPAPSPIVFAPAELAQPALARARVPAGAPPPCICCVWVRSADSQESERRQQLFSTWLELWEEASSYARYRDRANRIRVELEASLVLPAQAIEECLTRTAEELRRMVVLERLRRQFARVRWEIVMAMARIEEEDERRLRREAPPARLAVRAPLARYFIEPVRVHAVARPRPLVYFDTDGRCSTSLRC
ncbi:hypothetical protein LshimejAT787_0111200 [Lyophyllum shimeji]|uniref:Uncharacterized protein n=1 Tax=Lyophyllum shimeji TaxID=47721 RepID=A0A9P3PE66_LYOSH|nr:hypothetical protein LshimejAT787_0111200 [Lyophyllum shimeji]